MAETWKKLAFEDDVVLKSLFNADTFLYATDDNVPVATSPADVMAALSGHAGAAFDFNSQSLTGVDNITIADESWIGIASDAERIVFHTAGDISVMGAKFGIGTMTPEVALHVYSSGATADLILERATNSTAKYRLRANSGEFSIYDLADSRTNLVIDTDGNLGIGTTSPDGNLHVWDASAGSVTADSEANVLVLEDSASNGLSILTPDANTGAIYFGSPSDNLGAFINWKYSDALLKVATHNSSGEISLRSGLNADAVRIDSSGNVGIGTTGPADELHVSNTASTAVRIETRTDAIGGTAGLMLKVDSGLSPTYPRAKGAVLFERTGSYGVGKLHLAVDTNANSEDATIADAKLTISNDGNVGIGTISPNEGGFGASTTVLSIQGAAADNFGVLELMAPDLTAANRLGEIRFANLDGGSAPVARAGIRSERDGADDAADLSFFTEATGGDFSEKMVITSTGNVDIIAHNAATVGLKLGGTLVTASAALLNEAGTFFASTDISAAEAETLTDTSDASALHTHASLYQPLDSDLTSLALLGTAAGKIAYTTGEHTWAEAAITAGGRQLLAALTEAESTQIEAIGDTTISSTQWGYLGACSAGGGQLLAALTEGESTQLEAIGATTITLAQWGYVGGADQAVKQADSPTFAGCDLGTGELTAGSVNRGSGTLTLEIGGTSVIDIAAASIGIKQNMNLATSAAAILMTGLIGYSNDGINILKPYLSFNSSSLDIYTDLTDKINIGDSTLNWAKLSVDVGNDSFGLPVLALRQLDVDKSFIKFSGTAQGASLTNNIVDEGDQASETRAGWLKIYVEDTGDQIADQEYFIPIYTLSA